MWGLIAGLLFLWLVCVVIGVVFKVVAWLVIVGVIFFILTLAFGVIHEVMSRHRHRM